MTDATKKNEYFVDAQKHETTEKTLTGEQIKKSAGVDPGYQLFLEEEGETPDKPIANFEVVELANHIRHFYAVKEIEYFVEAKKYKTTQPALTGAQIKASASVDPAYQLFLEEEGDKPDKPVADSEDVALARHLRHFYAVPPATFGR